VCFVRCMQAPAGQLPAGSCAMVTMFCSGSVRGGGARAASRAPPALCFIAQFYGNTTRKGLCWKGGVRLYLECIPIESSATALPALIGCLSNYERGGWRGPPPFLSLPSSSDGVCCSDVVQRSQGYGVAAAIGSAPVACARI
jgi:hypothetical protein